MGTLHINHSPKFKGFAEVVYAMFGGVPGEDIVEKDYTPIVAIRTDRVYTLEEQQQRREGLRKVELP